MGIASMAMIPSGYGMGKQMRSGDGEIAQKPITKEELDRNTRFLRGNAEPRKGDV